MQRILSALGQSFRRGVLILGLISLISLSSLFIPVAQSSYVATAAPAQAQEEDIDVLNYTDAPAKSREEAYEEAAEAAESPDKVLKAEEKEIKQFKKAESGGGLVEGAQNLLDKVTGNS